MRIFLIWVQWLLLSSWEFLSSKLLNLPVYTSGPRSCGLFVGARVVLLRLKVVTVLSAWSYCSQDTHCVFGKVCEQYLCVQDKISKFCKMFFSIWILKIKVEFGNQQKFELIFGDINVGILLGKKENHFFKKDTCDLVIKNS